MDKQVKLNNTVMSNYKRTDISTKNQIESYLTREHPELEKSDREYAITNMVKACESLPLDEIQFTHIFNQLFTIEDDNPKCGKHKESEVLPDEQNNCSLCGSLLSDTGECMYTDPPRVQRKKRGARMDKLRQKAEAKKPAKSELEKNFEEVTLVVSYIMYANLLDESFFSSYDRALAIAKKFIEKHPFDTLWGIGEGHEEWDETLEEFVELELEQK